MMYQNRIDNNDDRDTRKHWRNKTVVDLLYKHVYVIFT